MSKNARNGYDLAPHGKDGGGKSVAESSLTELLVRPAPVLCVDDQPVNRPLFQRVATAMSDRDERSRIDEYWPYKGRGHTVFARVLSAVFLRRTKAGRGTRFVRRRKRQRQNGKQPKTTPHCPAFPLCSTTRSLAACRCRDGPIRRALPNPSARFGDRHLRQNYRKGIAKCAHFASLRSKIIAEVSQNACRKITKRSHPELFSSCRCHPLLIRGAL